MGTGLDELAEFNNPFPLTGLLEGGLAAGFQSRMLLFADPVRRYVPLPLEKARAWTGAGSLVGGIRRTKGVVGKEAMVISGSHCGLFMGEQRTWLE